jgi:hypothetical protein
VVDFDIEFRHVEGSRSVSTIRGKETSDHPLHILVIEISTPSLDA